MVADTGELTLGNSLLEGAMRDRSSHAAYPLLAKLMRHPAYVSGVTFTTSFSKERDLLSQWRAYAADGSGFAVGFHTSGLDGLVVDGRDVIYHLLRVEYTSDAQSSLASRIVDAALVALDGTDEDSLNAQAEQLLTTALGLILPFVELTFPVDGKAQALSRIIVGPKNPPDTISRVRMLLANAGVQSWATFPIEHAAATYR
jgi:hypothetical protein